MELLVELCKIAAFLFIALVLKSCTKQLDNQTKEIEALRSKLSMLERRLDQVEKS